MLEIGSLDHNRFRVLNNILNYEKIIATAGIKEIMVRKAAGYGIAGSQAYTKYIWKQDAKLIDVLIIKKIMFYILM